jgi:KaiC/GvpD/RAD55 family RecA-like ATPase
MLTHLRFGIPSLDSLFGGKEEGGGERKGGGIRLPQSDEHSHSSVSVCLTGPDGTGKSILGLHLAAHYVADCIEAANEAKKANGAKTEKDAAVQAKVLYVSTDLKFGMANKVWLNFGLDRPNGRTVPFEEGARRGDEDPPVKLIPCWPLEGARSPREDAGATSGAKEARALSHYLSAAGGKPEVYFVDLASATAGDDWGYVNRVLSSLEEPGEGRSRHLMVIDSVEGFETLVGERDAFGLVRERRSRIAQVMRSAGDKCHTLLVVEEPREEQHLPEEFVTDVVIRLRSTPVKHYVRRTIEVEKARGHSHVRGQHSYLIRSGAGSTTGRRQNYDDPKIENLPTAAGEPGRAGHQSYLHVCPSLHHIYRSRMTGEGKGRPAEKSERYAAFGIRYLDDMLETSRENFKRTEGSDERGLRCGTTTALIGNSETQKSPLGYAFLSRCFRSYAARYCYLVKQLAEMVEPLAGSPKEVSRALRAERRRADWPKVNVGPKSENLRRQKKVLKRLCRTRVYINDEFGRFVEKNDVGFDDKKTKVIHKVVRTAAWMVGPPVHPDDGIPVLLTTLDVHAGMLALRFLPWLLRKVPELKTLEADHPGCLAALRILMEQYTVCRRLEIHDLPSAVLIHIMQRAIDEAHSILDGNVLDVNRPTARTGERAERSWGIRVVIDDFSIIKNTYVEISEEPLLLRFLVFYLGQQGVTTLLIDTQPGRPDTTVASPLNSELRSLVDDRIYTWRVPFYGEDRVAIAVIPPVSSESPAVIRELRRGIKTGTGPEKLPLVVDPHFEMYSGIEKGEPQPIPLEILLFEELPAFKAYIEHENLRYDDLFTPLPNAGRGTPGKIITGIPAADYDKLRDLCYLQRDTRLDHTLVFQVDEFWMVPRRGLRRAGAFRPQWQYLNAATAVKKSKDEWEREWAIDPFRLFQPTAWHEDREDKQEVGSWHRRRMEFVWHGHELELDKDLFQESSALAVSEGVEACVSQQKKEDPSQKPKDEKAGTDAVDRVPFMWDFGFLLCRARLWEESKAELSFLRESVKSKWGREKFEEKWQEEEFKSVWDVWEKLPKATKGKAEGGERPSWRVFLEACYQLAKEQTYSRSNPVRAFDLHISAPQALSCLLLEVWASEIYRKEQNRARLKEQVAERRWEQRQQSEGLIQWLEDYKLELFKAWLLLIEVLDMEELALAVKEGSLRMREPDPSSVATRHWYKTAGQVSKDFSIDDPVVPVGLPGHFSVRGDWFLTVAGGSRSERLADRAMDLLSSRRANYTRLKQGLGLPTRLLVFDQLRTCLVTLDYGSPLDNDAESPTAEAEVPAGEKRPKRPRRESRVLYENLIKIGGPLKSDAESASEKKAEPKSPQDFHWFWRSGLANYHRHARVLQDWLSQMILWWGRMRYVERDSWKNGFKRYDEIVAHENSGDEIKGYLEKPDEELEAWTKFKDRCEHLLEELKQATP